MNESQRFSRYSPLSKNSKSIPPYLLEFPSTSKAIQKQISRSVDYPVHNFNVFKNKNTKKPFKKFTGLFFSSKSPNRPTKNLSEIPNQVQDPQSSSEYYVIFRTTGPFFDMNSKPKAKSEIKNQGLGIGTAQPNSVIYTKFSPLPSEREMKNPDKIGPGSYSPILVSNGPKWGFGASKRIEIDASESPGPGTYTVPSYLSKKAFSISPRRKNKEPSQTPGPGAYYKHSVGKAMKSSLRPRIEHRGQDLNFNIEHSNLSLNLSTAA
ncbi:hypothetical protein SteCoe_3506 [Stentor coeruleus]|uniref:Uncharacterized protein n=1 Tax=Stentor coeruleus TaxID=5963 RepID=A0A1R2CWY9_9CILI|nr:hypothetical protein SteCoe_3506 [Stentor coeruleus]